ncbi:unnamed protein product, partial [Phaeothamnion confervicola]
MNGGTLLVVSFAQLVKSLRHDAERLSQLAALHSLIDTPSDSSTACNLALVKELQSLEYTVDELEGKHDALRQLIQREKASLDELERIASEAEAELSVLSRHPLPERLPGDAAAAAKRT